jgi:hypothetical protein
VEQGKSDRSLRTITEPTFRDIDRGGTTAVAHLVV